MYMFVRTINYFIRENILSNPFEFVSGNYLMVYLFTTTVGSCMLYKIAYSMCGIFYRRGQAPILGSILYMVFFILNIKILTFIAKLFVKPKVVFILYGIRKMEENNNERISYLF